jgi:peptidoglycan hydrolase CwlO-like protein
MTEAEIYANPQRIQALADELHLFVSSLRAELEKMSGGIHDLGSTWRDTEYEKFKRSCAKLQEEIGTIDQEITRREPELEEDARSLLAFLNQSPP